MATINVRSAAYLAKMNGIVDDTIAIQKAIDASKPGDIITGLGTAAVRSIHFKNKKDLKIQLNIKGLNGTFLEALGFGHKCTVLMENCVRCELSNSSISNGEVALYNCDYCTVEKCNIKGATRLAHITSGSSRNCRYISNNIGDAPVPAIRGIWDGNHGSPSESSIISFNIIDNATATSIVYMGHGGLISTNTCKNKSGSGIIVSSTSNVEGRYTSIIGNDIWNTNTHGIQSDSMPGTYTNGVICKGNICRGNKHSGIYALRCKNWIITENNCEGNGHNGMTIDDASQMQIANNSFNKNGNFNIDFEYNGNGISIQNYTDVNNISLIGNSCIGNHFYGISVFNVVEGEFHGKINGLQLLGGMLLDNKVGLRIQAYKMGDIQNVKCDIKNILMNNRESNILKNVEVDGTIY
jgi:hypothetical protein